MGTQPLPAGTESRNYPYPLFRRVIFVPGSQSAVSGTVLRGLGEGAVP